MRVVRRISAVLIGFVFFLSGILKIMDPVGAKLVVEEYLKFLHIGFLSSLSGVIGTGMALLEALLGAALITGVWRKVTGVVTGVVMGFFTLLTLLLYIKNPSMDCGCFGEIVHLTHLQSLLKNVVLLALWALAFLPLSKQEQTRKIKYFNFPVAAAAILAFLVYSQLNIPLVDFTPFKPGAELMLPEDIDRPEDRSPTLPLSDASGEYVDEILLDGTLLTVSVYEPDRLKPRQWEKLAALLQDAASAGYKPMLLAASTPSMMEQYGLPPEVLASTWYADRKQLLTLNRDNGGATFIQDGLIVTKWGIRHLPDSEKLTALAGTDVTESLLSENNGDRMKFQVYVLAVFAILLLV